MTKTKFLIAASLSLGLAGCGAMGANTSVYSTNQPVVERTNYMIDVNSNGSGDFAPNEKMRLTEWLSAMNLRYGDRIAIDFGSGYPNASTTQAVSKMASEYGIILADTAPVTAGHVAPGTMRIVLSRRRFPIVRTGARPPKPITTPPTTPIMVVLPTATWQP
jgi:pilus assembly protein CpaD